MAVASSVQARSGMLPDWHCREAKSVLACRRPGGHIGAHLEAAMTIDGLTSKQSRHGPKETMDRLEAAVRAKGMTVFARIDHALGAVEAGLILRPTELLIFGNARGGTPLMRAMQT